MDLSSFRQLRSLGWKAPSPKNLKALLVALQLNSMHLQELDLDLTDLERARMWRRVNDNDDYESGSYDLGVILGMDLQDLAIFRYNSKALLRKNSTQHHPFSRLDLECLGLSCAPGKLLKSILRPFQTKNSLKLLHLRQSYQDLTYYKCLGLKKRFLDNGGLMSLDDGPKGGMMDQAEALRGLRSLSRQFLKWAFGLNGIPSLQVVAFGDFTMSDAHSKHNIIACKDTNESTRFQIISPSHPKMHTILSEYGDVLRACSRTT
ncbi:hypothetical protein GGR55DRAFT_200902 [Xylaria sp. FL0064]|nr:hypothetical protein GGR55DRAFT_200902 [Xylaria sp. FL0064]